MSEWCKHLRWIECTDGDYYECIIGHECSSDWCEDIAFGGKSECEFYEGVKV